MKPHSCFQFIHLITPRMFLTLQVSDDYKNDLLQQLISQENILMNEFILNHGTKYYLENIHQQTTNYTDNRSNNNNDGNNDNFTSTEIIFPTEDVIKNITDKLKEQQEALMDFMKEKSNLDENPIINKLTEQNKLYQDMLFDQNQNNIQLLSTIAQFQTKIDHHHPNADYQKITLEHNQKIDLLQLQINGFIHGMEQKLSDINHKFSRIFKSNTSIGETGEDYVEFIIRSNFQDISLENTSKSAEHSDYFLTNHDIQLLIECKMKDKLKTDDFSKFIRDVARGLEHKRINCAIFISLYPTTLVNGKQTFVLDTYQGIPIIYISGVLDNPHLLITSILILNFLVRNGYFPNTMSITNASNCLTNTNNNDQQLDINQQHQQNMNTLFDILRYINQIVSQEQTILEKEKRAIDLLLNTYHERKMHFIDICEHIQKMFQKFSIQYEPISTDVCNKKKMLKNMVDKYLLEHPNYEANVNNIYKLPDNTIPNTKKRKFTKNEIQQLYFNENE